ncbi:MAG: SDR family oxidoreductase [Oligoflexia bacterium]|nr:SDR family oxidoreductase [Oligoflexia bacterium]
MKHVLVTGGAGFIGSHLCDLLLSKGYAVTAVDNLVTGRKENLEQALLHPKFSYVEWDVCQPLPEEKLPLVAAHGLFGIFHFACPASPVDFERIPLEILAVDSVGTMNCVSLALKHRARVMLASTSEIYGDPLVHPQTEEYWGNVNTIGPRACYDETKRFGEAYVSSAARKLALDARIVRIFNTYGPRMRPDDGRIVPELCMQALRGVPLTVHGEGRQTRSFCYVSDLVDGIVRLFESDVKVPVNIGNPSERTVMEFAQAVLKLTGSRSEIRHLPERPDDPKRRCPEITRAKTLLGWAPKIDLEAGLSATLDYFREAR